MLYPRPGGGGGGGGSLPAHPGGGGGGGGADIRGLVFDLCCVRYKSGRNLKPNNFGIVPRTEVINIGRNSTT